MQNESVHGLRIYRPKLYNTENTWNAQKVEVVNSKPNGKYFRMFTKSPNGFVWPSLSLFKKLSCKCTFKDSMRFPIRFSFVDPGFTP